MLTSSQILKENFYLVEQIIRFLTAPAIDQNLYEEIQQICSSRLSSSSIRDHDFYLKEVGYFCLSDFNFYMQQKERDWKGDLDIVLTSLKLLVEYNLLTELPTGALSNDRLFWKIGISHNYIKFMVNEGLIYNLFFGFDYIINRYRSSIFKIGVSDSMGQESLGTAFLLKDTNIIITNKHVADKAISKIVDEKEETEFAFEANNIIFSDSDDLALIPLKKNTNLNLEGLIPNPEINVLDEIITLGYPRIPLSKFSYLVAHRGEVNSYIENYTNNELFIISARTSPGSSGSPILDKTGRFIGIVSENLFEEDSFKEKGILPYHAGIPASRIMKFIHEKLPSISLKSY